VGGGRWNENTETFSRTRVNNGKNVFNWVLRSQALEEEVSPTCSGTALLEPDCSRCASGKKIGKGKKKVRGTSLLCSGGRSAIHFAIALGRKNWEAGKEAGFSGAQKKETLEEAEQWHRLNADIMGIRRKRAEA